MKFHHNLSLSMAVAALAMLAITNSMLAASTVTETAPTAPTCYRGSTAWSQPGGKEGCLDAALEDAGKRVSGTYKYSFGWASAASRTRWAIRVKQPKVATQLPAAPPSIVGAWELRSAYWHTFSMPYDGVVRMRGIDGHGQTTIDRPFKQGAQVTCTFEFFAATDPAIGYSKECVSHPDGVVVPDATVSLPMMAQMPGMPIVDKDRIPAPSVFGTSELRLRKATAAENAGVGHGDVIGAFRNSCDYSHFNFDDLIVSPGQPGAAHLHVYCGNTTANALSTTATLLAGKSTSGGGMLNPTPYWMPALLNCKPAVCVPLVPIGGINYYKTAYNQIPVARMIWPPYGMKMIGGADPQNTKVSTLNTALGIEFTCIHGDAMDEIKPGSPECLAGSTIRTGFKMPNCWNGKDLDSPDHRSHLAYSGNGACPASHPVGMVEIALHFDYTMPAGISVHDLKFSCDRGEPGACIHGDLVVLHDEARFSDPIMEHCERVKANCGTKNRGDGWTFD